MRENSNGVPQFAMEVCSVEAVDRSTISRWAERFREARLSIENDPKSGRPRMSTDDQSVERVLQILEEDRKMTCEGTAHSAGISRALPTAFWLNACTNVELPPGGFHMTSVRNKSVDIWKLHNNCCTDFVKKGTNFCKIGC